jgi:hypothetical protein
MAFASSRGGGRHRQRVAGPPRAGRRHRQPRARTCAPGGLRRGLGKYKRIHRLRTRNVDALGQTGQRGPPVRCSQLKRRAKRAGRQGVQPPSVISLWYSSLATAFLTRRRIDSVARLRGLTDRRNPVLSQAGQICSVGFATRVFIPTFRARYGVAQ